MDTDKLTVLNKETYEEVTHLFRQVVNGLEELQDLTGLRLDIHYLVMKKAFERWQDRHVIAPLPDPDAEWTGEERWNGGAA